MTAKGPVSPQRFPYQSEDGSPILRNRLHPRQPPHHGEIDTAKTQACQEDVDTITQWLIIHRVHGLRQGLRTVSVDPSIGDSAGDAGQVFFRANGENRAPGQDRGA
jgi:hypothetical protein